MDLGSKDIGDSWHSLRTQELVAVNFHLFHNFVIVNDINFKLSAVVDNNIAFALQQ